MASKDKDTCEMLECDKEYIGECKNFWRKF